MLVEIWDDFIGVPRTEDNMTAKATLGTLGSKPSPPTFSADHTKPALEDFDCLGNMCSSILPIAEGNTKSFGVYGLLGEGGLDFNEESTNYFNHEKGEFIYHNTAEDYTDALCRPKVFQVLAYVKDGDYVPASDDSIQLTFSNAAQNVEGATTLNLLQGPLASDYPDKFENLEFTGKSDIEDFADFYESDGSLVMKASMVASAATLAAMTLF